MDHVFFGCDLSLDVWSLVRRWTDIDMPSFSSLFVCLQWFEDWRAPRDDKDRVYVIVVALLWCLWRYRNRVTFSSHSLRKSDIFDYIRTFSFSWLKSRGRNVNCWNSWLMKPL